MKKGILFLFAILFIIQGNAIIEETGDFADFLMGVENNAAYSNWISHVVEGIASEGYNMYAPYDRQTEGFGQFTEPTEEQTSIWEEAIDYFFAGQYNQAHNLFIQNNIPYSVVKFTDDSDVFYMLRENLNSTYLDDNGTTATYDDEIGSFDLGWGLYVYRSTASKPIVVTTPHPNDDFISPLISLKCFEELDAQYFMINGSGREVMWNEFGNYSNNKSISDPTRNHEHPFNYFYAKACDKVREDFSRRELSVQIHSYDWISHENMASCQLSPGQYNRPAGLPIRDFSPLREDVVQNTDYIVIPQGSIGNNEEVTINDYYSVYNYFYPTVYHDSLIIRSDVDLSGYPNSFQDIYTTDGFSDWDVFSPFFHVEFDELPDSYPANEESFKTFYGFNTYTNSWNLSQRFTKLSAYYEPFMEAFVASVNEWIDFDDELVPDPPSNVRRYYGGYGNPLAWDSAPSYDFYSYEILYSLEPISAGNYTVLDRADLEKLAYPLVTNISIPDLELNQTYHIAMRTVDYNGNVSAISDEIIYNTLPIVTSAFDLQISDSSISFFWTMSQQQNCAGFEVYRKEGDGEFSLYSSYLDNEDLEITTYYTEYFSFEDTNVDIGVNYSYKVHVVNTAGTSGQLSQVMNANLAEYVTLLSSGNSWDESITIGKSNYASSEYDPAYDELNESTNNYLAIVANNQQLTRNVISNFDPTSQVSSFDLVIDNPPENVTFSIDTSRYSERFYLEYNDELYSLNDQDVLLNFFGQGSFNLKLIWGNLQAAVSFPNLVSAVVYQGQETELTWEIDYPELVDHVDLYLKNDSDSVFVAANLSPWENSISYTYNQNHNYRMLNLVAETHAIDNQENIFKSYSRFVFLAELDPINLSAYESNQLFSYPFASSLDISDLSESLQAYTLQNGEFIPTNVLDNNHAYFLNIEEDEIINHSGNPNLADTEYTLVQGWNHIYNPHPIDYAIQDILFEINGLVKSFKSLVDNQNILPLVLGVRDGSYTVIDTLRAFESAFIRQESSSLINLRFDPVNQSEAFNFINPELFYTLEFKSTSGAKDELIVGIQENLTPVIDFYYDFMKGPLRPTYGLTEAYIIPEAPLNNYFPKMHRKLVVPSDEQTYTWDIAFTNTLNEVVQVRIKDSANPNNYPLDLYYGGNSLRLTGNYQEIPNTQTSGTYHAELAITTITDNAEHDTIPLKLLAISPNPIIKSADIKISNTRNKDFSLSIYNIKGQKVKDYHIIDCKNDVSNLTWDLSNNQGKRVSSGIYFIRYKDNKRSELRKVCVMK